MPYFSSCLGLQNVWGRPWVRSTIFNTAQLVSCFLLLFIFKCFYYLGFFLLFLLWLLMWVLNDLWILEGMVELVNVCEIWECGFVHFLGSCKVQNVSVLLIVSLLRMCAKTEEYGKWNFQFIKMFNLVKQEQMVNMVNPAKTR